MTDSVINSELLFSKPFSDAEKQLLTPDAIAFLQELVTRFAPRRERLLAARQVRQKEYDSGGLPDFDMETVSIREQAWTIRGIPAD